MAAQMLPEWNVTPVWPLVLEGWSAGASRGRTTPGHRRGFRSPVVKS